MNKQELIDFLNAGQRSEFISCDTEYFSESDNEFLGSIEYCTSETDYDDGYNNTEVVYHFPKWECHVQMNGYYASHQGSEYEEMYEVRPEQVTKTEYYRV